MWLLEPIEMLSEERRKKETGAIQDLSVTKSQPGKNASTIGQVADKADL